MPAHVANFRSFNLIPRFPQLNLIPQLQRRHHLPETLFLQDEAPLHLPFLDHLKNIYSSTLKSKKLP